MGKKRKIQFFSQQQNNPEYEDDVVLADFVEVAYPRQFKVLIHNDNYTSMEFVVMLLKKYFNKTGAEAKDIMLAVHSKGKGIAGIYTKEIAETKIFQAMQAAKENQFPLRFSMEQND